MKARAYVKPERADGKFAVQFVYPTTGARVNKVYTRAQLQEMIDSRNYDVSGQPRDMEAK